MSFAHHQENWVEKLIWWNVLLVTILGPLAFGTVEEWSIALFELNALLVAVALAGAWLLRPESFELKRWRIAAPFAALVAFNALQFAVPHGTLDRHATAESAFKLLALLVYFLAALHLLREGARRRQLMFVLSALGFALALFAIAQKLTYNGKLYWVRPVSPYVAPFGPYANYNHFAGAMELLLPVPLAWWLLARAEIGKRIIAFWAAVAMIVALVYSLSRGGLLALGAQLTALFYFLWRERTNAAPRMKNTQTPLLIGVALTVSLLLVMGLAYDQLAARFQSLQQGSQEYSLVTRRAFWSNSWRMFRAHPLTGVGLGAFPTAYPQVGHSSAQNERLETVHNDYLQLLTDAGLVGAVLLLWFCFEAVRQLRSTRQRWMDLRSNDRAACLGGWLAVLGLAVHSLLDFNLQITANAWLCLCLLALAISSASADLAAHRKTAPINGAVGGENAIEMV